MSGYKPFSEVLGEVLAKAGDKHDKVIPAKEFVGGLKRMGDLWGIETEKEGTFHLTKPAMIQLVKERLGGLPALFNDKAVSERTAQSYMMDRVLSGQENKPLTLRVTGTQIDGVLSDAYSFFDNTRLMLLLAGFTQAGFLPQELFAHSYHVSPGARELHLRLIAPDHWDFRNGEQYYGSLAFSNNELGLGSLTVAPALARVACFNFCVAQSTVNASHRFADVEELDRAIEQGVKHIEEYSKVMFERTQHSHDVMFDNPESVFHQVGKALNLPDYVELKARSYWVQEGQDRSLFGIVQAFTNGTQELTATGKGKRIQRWADRDHIENKVYMWSEDIMDRHQLGTDVNEIFSSAELIQKSKVLEVLKSNKQWQPASELVETMEPAGWVN